MVPARRFWFKWIILESGTLQQANNHNGDYNSNNNETITDKFENEKWKLPFEP